MLKNFLRRIHYLFLFSFKPSRTTLTHSFFCLIYILFLSAFRYAVFFKCNYEFRQLTKDSKIGLYYHRLDKSGDVYRFGVGQFYEYLTINKIYKEREKVIAKDTDYLFISACQIFYKCIVYLRL